MTEDEIKLNLDGRKRDEIRITDSTPPPIEVPPDSTEIPPAGGIVGEFDWGEIPPMSGEAVSFSQSEESEPVGEFDPAEVIELLNGEGLLDDVLAQGLNVLGDKVAESLKKAKHQGIDPETVQRYKVVDALIKVIHYYAATAPIGHPLTALTLSLMMCGLAYATSPVKTPPSPVEIETEMSSAMSDEEFADELSRESDWG